MAASKLLKILLGLSILLALGVGVRFYLMVPQRRTPFLKTVDQARRIAIAQGPARVDLRHEGKDWKASSGQGALYPADADKVKTLLSGLRDVQVEDEISQQADSGDYDLTPASGTQVTLFGTGQKRLAEGVFGKQAPDFTHIYFRFPGKPEVYLARNIIRGELVGAGLNDWRDRTLIDLPEAKIESVVIEGHGFTTSLARSSDTWTLGGKTIDPAPVYALLGALAHLKADEFVAPSTSTPSAYDALGWARIKIKASDRSIELRIGDEDKPRQRYPAAVGPDGSLVWLYETHVKPFLLKPSDFHSK